MPIVRRALLAFCIASTRASQFIVSEATFAFQPSRKMKHDDCKKKKKPASLGTSDRVGVTTYYDGTPRYDGSWDTFSRQGNGTFKFTSGTVYEGNWTLGCIQSTSDTICKCQFRNGDVYEGEWANGEMSGQGEYRYANGDVYKGGWAHSKRQGSGVYKYSNGWVHLGAWLEGKKHGESFFTNGEDGPGFIEDWKIGTSLTRQAVTVEEILARKEEIREEEAAKKAEEDRLARIAKTKEVEEIKGKLEAFDDKYEGEDKDALVARLAQLEEELGPPPEEEAATE